VRYNSYIQRVNLLLATQFWVNNRAFRVDVFHLLRVPKFAEK